MSTNTQEITYYQKKRDKILNRGKEYYQKKQRKKKECRKNRYYTTKRYQRPKHNTSLKTFLTTKSQF